MTVSACLFAVRVLTDPDIPASAGASRPLHVIAPEGSLLNADCLAIPKGAPRPGNAHLFLNYLLDAKVGAEISKTIQYPTPNAAAKALMDPAYRNSAVVFPPPAILARCDYAAYAGEATARLHEETITRVRAA